jgi:ParB family chromosome partitioning protein
MSAESRKRGLGRGLDALFQDVKREEVSFEPKLKRANEIAPEASARVTAPQANAPVSGQRKISIDRLTPGKFQPRHYFDDASIDQLAESIAIHGVIQPLLVRPLNDTMFEIVAGERRWRAAQKAQVHELPVVVQLLNDNDALEIALIENLQREDLNVLEEAEGYQRLMDEFQHTQEVLAHHLGKSRSHVTNTLRLLKLSPKIKDYVQKGALSAGHARTLIGCPTADDMADVIIQRGLNVRQTEALVKNSALDKKPASAKKAKNAFSQKDVDVLALEQKMSSLLGLRVTIDSRGAEGSIRIDYKSLDQLDGILEKLS